MPYRLNERVAKIQFVTSAAMPSLIYKACVRTQTVSNTAYIQRAVCEALARDLGLHLEDLIADLPPRRGTNNRLFHGPTTNLPGPAGTIEEVI